MPRRRPADQRESSSPTVPEHDPPQIRPPWTFSVWLAFQEPRKDKVGELARLVREDRAWPGWRGIEGLEAYCREQRFSAGWIAALKQAWSEWEAAKGASEGAPRGKK